jgi:hypothetical protein
MNSVTVGVPVVAGPPDAAIPAPVAGGQPHHNYTSAARAPSARYRAPGAAPRPGERPEALSCPAGARLPPEAERALAELEDALEAHGRPCPERTAAWFGALGRGERA